MNQMWENGKTPNFGAEIWAPKFFLWILPVLYVRHCYKLSLYATSRKNNQPILTKWQKNLVSGPILVYLTQIWVTNIFFKKHLASSIIRYGQLSSCTKSEKANGPVLRKPSDEWTDGQTDRRTGTISYDAAQLTPSVQKLKHDERRCRNKKKYMKNYYYKKNCYII